MDNSFRCVDLKLLFVLVFVFFSSSTNGSVTMLQRKAPQVTLFFRSLNPRYIVIKYKAFLYQFLCVPALF